MRSFRTSFCCSIPKRNFSYLALRNQKKDSLSSLREVIQKQKFAKELKEGRCKWNKKEGSPSTLEEAGMSQQQMMSLINTGFCTFLLHKEARVASALSQGFYTIGSAGEEMLAGVGLALRPTDPVALHYRHLATSLVRQFQQNNPLEQILLDRARGYCVSSKDPVSGGRHCLLGGGKFDFPVTSTLASQASPAVGRALGAQLAHRLKVETPFPLDSVSYVSVGDGSVNNAHFLAATNLAKYAKHRSFKCPVVFGISDNHLSISLRGFGWLQQFAKNLGMPVFECDGTNGLEVYSTTVKAVASARKRKQPVALVFSDLPRRFGHAATDRQFAYLEQDEIDAAENANPLSTTCAQAVELGVASYEELSTLFESLNEKVKEAFEIASKEEKITTREQIVASNSQPISPYPVLQEKKEPDEKAPKSVMRKNMNLVIKEAMDKNPSVVYIGEDVTHGGYYIVTEGLAKIHPGRITDFPPDETSLIGAGIGYAQAGLLPIVEIPYAKYLDCGVDMLFEAVVNNWLSNGKHPNGMLIRLQGFGKGIFGGNFHTHNSLHLPPGMDVVCYSNGEDYVKGFRYAMHQASKGRVVMTVDSTDLLNLRHIEAGDDKWRRAYPKEGEFLSFDDVVVYPPEASEISQPGPNIAVVSYGNAVVTSLRARSTLKDVHGLSNVTVIDSPLLSDLPSSLKLHIPNFDGVVFADECKEWQNPLASMITRLQNEQLLPTKWKCVTSARTYNPLGTDLTFLNQQDIINSVLSLASS